nr:LLM class flavin-dependent oxidoreductase [Streptomyces sp. A1277]
MGSPDFRHPVTLAKELIALDDISNGRITLGIGAGGTGFDATTLLRSDEVPWTPRRRADRFGEFVSLLDALLRGPAGTSYEGQFYAATEARNVPGCVQRPRLPFADAATGPRGLALAARYGQAWVTTGDPKLYEAGSAAGSLDALRRQADGLGRACAEAGREVAELDKILLTGFTPEFNPALAGAGGRPFDSVGAFVDFAGRHAELGFTELVIHAPVPVDGPGWGSTRRWRTRSCSRRALRGARPSWRTDRRPERDAPPSIPSQPGRRRNAAGTAEVSHTPLALT